MASTYTAGESRSAHFAPRPERVWQRRRSTAASASSFRPGSRPGFADRASFMSTDSGYFSEDYWEEEEESVPVAASLPRAKRDEQMSPVAVVLYVVFFYVVWQILTRSDDTEILEHLPSGSPLLSSPHQPSHYERNPPTPQYQLPYALQQFPAAIASPTSDTSPSTWRWVLGTLVYPIYIAITLVAIPLPFLMNALNLIVNIVTTILYPITSTFRLLARTFVIAPLTVLLGFLQALYPVYVFVGGVVGAGAFIGVAFGWVGRVVLSILLRPRANRKRKSLRSRSKRNSSSSTRPISSSTSPVDRESMSRERDPRGRSEPPATKTHAHNSTSKRHSLPAQSQAFSPAHTSQGRTRPTSANYEYERRFVPIVDVIELDDDGFLPYEQSHATARQGVVLGVRRRGTRH